MKKASDAAYEVLAANGGPLHVRELTDRMIAQGLWASDGMTPDATVGATLGTEINTKGAASRFVRREANVFDLRRPDDPVPPVPTGSKNWLFQYNPRLYDLIAVATTSASEIWSMNQHRDFAAYGDLIYFYQSGDKAGVYAIGRIQSTAYRAEAADDFGAWKVDVVYESVVEPPLLRAEITADPILVAFTPFTGRMGTNFPIPEAVAVRLAEALAPRLHPVSATTSRPTFNPVNYDVDRAVERARQQTKDDLLVYLRALGPAEFEHVIRLLLQALDYEDVVVTGRSGDHGIDVRAKLRYRGIAEVPTYVQAKRYAASNSVTQSAVGYLRGSLPVDAHGMVITTSDFTKQARAEASEPGLKPIALVNGTSLVELLVDLGIGGVEKRQVEVTRFSPERLHAELDA